MQYVSSTVGSYLSSRFAFLVSYGDRHLTLSTAPVTLQLSPATIRADH